MFFFAPSPKELRGGDKEVAVKVAKSNRSATEQARDEVDLLKCIFTIATNIQAHLTLVQA